MKNFLIKLFVFLIPLLVLVAITKFYYSQDFGDLARIGYLKIEKNSKKKFEGEAEIEMRLKKFCESSNIEPNKINVLIVGDSFSGQREYGYGNYLAQNKNLNVIRFDLFKHNNKQFDNPISLLNALIQNKFFKSAGFDFVILQSVERYFGKRLNSYAKNKFGVDKINALCKKNAGIKLRKQASTVFPPKEIFNFPLYSLLYKIDDNAFFSKVYKVELNDNLFANFGNTLHFIHEDLKYLKYNNTKKHIQNLNNLLNKFSKNLKEENVDLIVLPAPDKLSIYYDYIKTKNDYPQPKFFKLLNEMNKKYLFINSKELLLNEITSSKDLYYFYDTHWTPKAAQLISDEVEKQIYENYAP